MRTGIVISLAAISSWGCRDQGGLTHVNSKIEVPASLPFDQILLGTSKTVALEVSNRGDDVLHICVDGTEHPRCAGQASGVRPAGTPFTVAFDGVTAEQKSWNVEKGATRQLLITYTPVAEGQVGATLVLIHDAINGPSSLVELTGSSVGPRVELSPSSLDYGQLSVGRREERQITFANKTAFDTPVSVALDPQSSQQIGIVGEAGEVPVNQPLNATIPGEGTLTITVWMAPQAEGLIENGLSISYCTSCNTRVPVRGVGVKPTFQVLPGALDLGSLPEGMPASQSFMVRNSGMVDLT